MTLPILTTERLMLRPVMDDDADTLFALRSNPDVMKYIPRPLAQDIEDTRNIIAIMKDGAADGSKLNWAITLKGNNSCIGIIGFHKIYPENLRAEMGYMLLPEHHRCGIIPEAATAAINYGFSVMNLHSIEAITHPGNDASEKVLTRLGFTKEAHFKENIFFDGHFLDSLHYTLFR